MTEGAARDKRQRNAARKFLLPSTHCLLPTLHRNNDGESPMAKGQMKSNKEKRKPKKDKSAKVAPSAGGIGSGGKK